MLNHSNTKKLISFKLNPSELKAKKQNIEEHWKLDDKSISFNIFSSK